MKTSDYLQLAMFTNYCPGCGSCVIGGGEGYLIVEDDVFKRGCKCGFLLEYNVQEGTTREKVLGAIRNELRRLRVNFCVESVFELEGVRVDPKEFNALTDNELIKKVEWFDYLWTK